MFVNVWAPVNVATVLSMDNVLVAVMSPPPCKPVPVAMLTAEWSTCSFATKPLKLSWTMSASVVDNVNVPAASS